MLEHAAREGSWEEYPVGCVVVSHIGEGGAGRGAGDMFPPILPAYVPNARKYL